ncbi:hypothetical protein [Paraburkholderia elongata]|uniref:Uncharacterized protein n=1 Tax=Paraburkholderia elongata TaxID=2675747 RepID=A0A972NQ65_9BURK|nr:hypothetical protein [Paraburkholderia elongata]NPT56423.1 hypothetical protein [Paraburkholderia elongata]
MRANFERDSAIDGEHPLVSFRKITRTFSLNRFVSQRKTMLQLERHLIIGWEAAMKRSTGAIWVLGVVAAVVLILVCIGDESSDEQTIRNACAYYGGSCVSPEIFLGASIRLFP